MTELLSGLEEPPPPIPEQVAEADIEPWRAHIDQIDLLLLHLMNVRARSASNIGYIKNQLHIPIYAPRREQEVLDNVISANEGPLSSQAVRRLFERLIDETRSLERQTYQDNPSSDHTA